MRAALPVEADAIPRLGDSWEAAGGDGAGTSLRLTVSSTSRHLDPDLAAEVERGPPDQRQGPQRAKRAAGGGRKRKTRVKAVPQSKPQVSDSDGEAGEGPPGKRQRAGAEPGALEVEEPADSVASEEESRGPTVQELDEGGAAQRAGFPKRPYRRTKPTRVVQDSGDADEAEDGEGADGGGDGTSVSTQGSEAMPRRWAKAEQRRSGVEADSMCFAGLPQELVASWAPQWARSMAYVAAQAAEQGYPDKDEWAWCADCAPAMERVQALVTELLELGAGMCVGAMHE